MQGDSILQQDFNTVLPIIRDTDSVDLGDTLYIKYLFDSLNVQAKDSTFVFELQKIIIPKDSDTIVSKVIYDKPSIFFPYKHAPVKILPRERIEVNYDWLTGLFILCLLIMTWIRYEGERRISQLFRGVFARHNMNQLFRDGDIIHERITPGLMFLYLISITTLIVTILRPYNIEIPGADKPFLLYSFIAGAILLFWLIKLATIRISGKIFRTRIETEEYLVTNLIYDIAAGLIAFPFVFAGHYAENAISIDIAIAIFALGIAARFIRSIFVGLSAQSFPVVYLFLYLCTLEILPFLVLYKLLF